MREMISFMPSAREATTRLSDLLRREHDALAEFLVALSVFQREGCWAELGYSSLFYFLPRELGLSKGAAYYRKTAAELVQAYPEVLAALREGKLCLSSIVELSKVLTPENRAEVLPRFFHVSKREAKEVTAELLPAAAPPRRTVVTAVRGTGGTTERVPDLGPAVRDEPSRACAAACSGTPPARASCSSTSVLASVDRAPDPGPDCEFTNRAVHPANLVHANAQVPGVASVASTAAAPARARHADVEPLTAELTRLHVTVPRRLLEKLAAARDALSHSHPRASDDEILELGLDLIVDRHRKRRGIGAKPRKPSVAPGPAVPPPAPPAVATAVALPQDARPAPPVPARSHTAPPQAQAASVRVAATAAGRPVAVPPAPSGRSRHVPAEVWRAVWERDRGRCVWPLDGGRVCGSTRKLQLDHVDGWALGAATTVDGCRILCAVHNDGHARELYGHALMNRYSRPKGAGGAERGAGP